MPSFSQQADGIVDSEGIGAVVLKPLEQAEVDGDHIYGVIKGAQLMLEGKPMDIQYLIHTHKRS